MGIAIAQHPANANQKEGWVLLEHTGFALFARQVGIAPQQLFGAQEGQVMGKVWIAVRSEFRKEGLGIGAGIPDDCPDLLHGLF